MAGAADTTVVLLAPGMGDGVQAAKAGILEIGDLFVVNKADRPGADRLARELSMMLHFRLGQGLKHLPAHHGVDLRRPARATEAAPPAVAAQPQWDIPVLKTVAETGDGVVALAEAIARHAAWLDSSSERTRRRRQRLAERVREQVARRLHLAAWQPETGAALLEEALPGLESGDISPYEVAARIVRAVLHE